MPRLRPVLILKAVAALGLVIAVFFWFQHDDTKHPAPDTPRYQVLPTAMNTVARESDRGASRDGQLGSPKPAVSLRSIGGVESFLGTAAENGVFSERLSQEPYVGHRSRPEDSSIMAQTENPKLGPEKLRIKQTAMDDRVLKNRLSSMRKIPLGMSAKRGGQDTNEEPWQQTASLRDRFVQQQDSVNELVPSEHFHRLQKRLGPYGSYRPVQRMLTAEIGKLPLRHNHTRNGGRVQGVLTQTEIDEEIQVVMNRMNKCLEVTNMSTLFKEAGYHPLARQNVEMFMAALRTVVPRRFNPNYFSPCWHVDFEAFVEGLTFYSRVDGLTLESKTIDFGLVCRECESALRKSGGHFTSKVACLPKVMILGFSKCGSMFLYSLLTKGLSLDYQLTKEPRFWVSTGPRPEKNPHIPDPNDVILYLTNFAKASRWIEGYNRSDVVTIDSTLNVLSDWTRYYSNEPPVNYCQMAAVIPEVLPDSKYIVVMRNPVDMMYSVFWYSCTSRSRLPREDQLRGPDIFHERVVTKLDQFHHCMQKYSLEWCVVNITYNLYSPELPSCGKTRFEVGIYYVQIHKWLSVNPRDNCLFLTLEEVSANPDMALNQLANFIGLPTYNSQPLSEIKLYKNTQHQIDYHNDPLLHMRRDTKQLLTSFFRPYNQKLAELLGDPKFLWED